MFPSDPFFFDLLASVRVFVSSRLIALGVFFLLTCWAVYLRYQFNQIREKYSHRMNESASSFFVKLESDSLHLRASMVIGAAISSIPLGFVMFLLERLIQRSATGTDLGALGLNQRDMVMILQLFLFVALVFLKFGSLFSATVAASNMKEAKL